MEKFFVICCKGFFVGRLRQSLRPLSHAKGILKIRITNWALQECWGKASKYVGVFFSIAVTWLKKHKESFQKPRSYLTLLNILEKEAYFEHINHICQLWRKLKMLLEFSVHVFSSGQTMKQENQQLIWLQHITFFEGLKCWSSHKHVNYIC